MDIKHLDYIIAIYEERNISRAAEKLFISQPTLSLYLQKLEQDLGVQLFNRIKSAMTLTYAGEIYVETALKILTQKKFAESLIEDIIDYKKGRLTVGFAPDRGSVILPYVIPKFTKIYPGIKLELVEDTAYNLEALTLKGHIDVTFIVNYIQDLHLEYQELGTEEIVLCIPKSHKLANKAGNPSDGIRSKIDLSFLKDEQFILSKPGTKIRQAADSILKDSNITPNIMIESGSITTILKLAATGAGLTFMPEMLAEHFDYDKSLVLFSIDPEKYSWPIIAAYRKDSYLTRAAEDFISLVKENVNS